MKSWTEYCKAAFSRRLLIHVAAVAMALSLTAYEFEKPVRAAAAVAEPAAAAPALDDNSVSALLSLDHAMEALAARVTPATVNVTVVSKKSAIASNQADGSNNDGDNDSNGIEQFFGKQFGRQFGRQFNFGPQMRPGPQIEHGL